MLIFAFFSCNSDVEKITDNDYYKFKKPLENVNKTLVEKDKVRIENYYKRRKWNMQVSGTGLYYNIYHKGKGEKAENEKYATINYEVKLLNGKLCYTSDSLGPKTFKVGHGGVEIGLEEGVLLMNEGDKARFIIPPYLAHGLIGDENRIPARSIIVYNVELLKVTD